MRKVILFCVAVLLFGACGEKASETIEFANSCKVENDGKYVSIAGYLKAGSSIFCSNIGGGRMDCSLTLTEKPDAETGYKASIEQGSGKNQIEKFERNYKKEDLKIRDNAGAMVAIGDKVKLTGKFSVTPDASLCFITVDKIEK